MSDLLGIRTKKVTTYGRRGNRNNFVPNHADLSPVRPAHVDLTSSTVATPVKRPPLQPRLSQEFTNIPQLISPVDTPDAMPKKKGKALRGTSVSDSPRLVRRMHRPGRAVIPSTRSSYAPTPGRPMGPLIDCVEIVSVRKRPTRPGASKLGRYRESSEDLADKLEQLVVSTPAPSGAVIDLTSTPSPPRSIVDLTQSPDTPVAAVSSTVSFPTLESVCSSPDIVTFDALLNIASSIGSSGSAAHVEHGSGITKVGEATYSEVFAVGSQKEGRTVMKVIPIAGSAHEAVKTEEAEDIPYCSPEEDVAREVEITQRMSSLDGAGFVHFYGAYVVQGSYHSHLLAQWDAYEEQHGTENIRPSVFGPEQRYVVIFLRDGGEDLEAFSFAKKTGWVQAAGIFWQVADALARAEAWTEFEVSASSSSGSDLDESEIADQQHRDLHEGQILIETCPTDGADLNPLDPSSSGVRATIIDFGLSRLRASDGRVVCTPIPDDVFEGEGEQWDVYRAIDKRVKGDWEGYHPVSNLLWLRYILNLLLHRTPTLRRPNDKSAITSSRSKAGRAAAATRTGAKAAESRDEASARSYETLRIAEKALESALSRRARRGLESKAEAATDLMALARDRGLVF